MKQLTIDQLSEALNVSRKTIERGLAAGKIVPTSRLPSGRVRFSVEYAELLKSRAAAARAAGHKYLLEDLASDTGPVHRGPRKDPPLSPQQFMAQVLWRHRNLHARAQRRNERAGCGAAPGCLSGQDKLFKRKFSDFRVLT